jgi:hypothetical protein
MIRKKNYAAEKVLEKLWQGLMPLVKNPNETKAKKLKRIIVFI